MRHKNPLCPSFHTALCSALAILVVTACGSTAAAPEPLVSFAENGDAEVTDADGEPFATLRLAKKRRWILLLDLYGVPTNRKSKHTGSSLSNALSFVALAVFG